MLGRRLQYPSSHWAVICSTHSDYVVSVADLEIRSVGHVMIEDLQLQTASLARIKQKTLNERDSEFNATSKPRPG